MAKALTVADLVKEITKLGTEKSYKYVSGNNSVTISRIVSPEGPIHFYRKSNNDELKRGSISAGMLAEIALVCNAKPAFPIHIDRVFSASGNSRSALESLLAYTPHFFICYPLRVNAYTGQTTKKLKHIMWCPDETHPIGEIGYKDFQGEITELEASIDFGNINISQSLDNIEAKKVHAQMQVALLEIGNALNLKSWIARNDHSVLVGNSRLIDLPGTVDSLDKIGLFFEQEIRDAASLIDCIWFTQNNREVPAIFEIEHSTGVTSGLTRMLKFREKFPAINPIYTIVAPDNLRAKVINEITQDIYKPLNARYMRYSNVRELYGLIQRYSLKNLVDYKFVAAFMEQFT